MAVKQREREAGGGPAGAGGVAGESPYAMLERALREAYEAVESDRTPGKLASIGLGGLLVKVYAKIPLWSDACAVIFEVYSRGDGGDQSLLCYVKLRFKDRKPYEFEVDCDGLKNFASGCAGGEGCALSWEEMERALGLAVWAANRLAKLAGIPIEVEEVGLVKAYDIWDGEVYAFPCLQVSIDGKSYSMCRRVHLSRNTSRSWRVERHGPRLIPIGEAHARVARALMELDEMVSEHTWSRESEGAKHIHGREHQGEFLELEEVVLRLPDGAEEVLLKPRFPRPYYIGEDFTIMECFYGCPEGSDGELADALRKELEEAWGVVVQEGRRYTEELDPRYAALAYIAAEALRKAWPSAGLA